MSCRPMGEGVRFNGIGTMSNINFYRQARYDGGMRTGVEIDGETVLERFEQGNPPENNALLWYVGIRCSGNALPTEAKAAREWLLENASSLQQGIRAVADDLRAGIDSALPISRPICNVAGVTVQLSCTAIRRFEAVQIANTLNEVSSHWEEFLKSLELTEPLAR
jgi:hypothetical protein